MTNTVFQFPNMADKSRYPIYDFGVITDMSRSTITWSKRCLEKAPLIIRCVWLFTRSDIKTIIIPKSIFGILGGVSSAGLVSTTKPDHDILRRIPLVVSWVWIVLLPFNIDNQRREASIEEDRRNRPWRPLPSRMITPDQAFRLMMTCHIAALGYSFLVGGFLQSLLGILFGWLYNGLGAADRSWVGKNIVNALGYITFSTGAITVATCGRFTPCGLQWFGLLSAVVFTTVQVQDLTDMEGDAARGRQTVPLVMGCHFCRWSIGILVPGWSVVASMYWGCFSLGAVICIMFGVAVSWRVLNMTSLQDDKLTFWLWNAWMVSLYILPLASAG
nr:hypothetical protein [Biscogniauxia sp.]